MTKRAFIDAIRQYAAAAKSKRMSFQEAVKMFAKLYDDANVERGMAEPELEKERGWITTFLDREYLPMDDEWTGSWSD